MNLHIASGYDDGVYDMTWEDFADPRYMVYDGTHHTWVVTAFTVTAPDTFKPITGCLAGWDGERITLMQRDGTSQTFVPESIHVLGDACTHS